MLNQRAILVFTTVGAVIGAAPVHAQPDGYPSRPIRMIVMYPPGGGVDLAARVIGQKLFESMGQQIIVDNRGGAGGNISMQLLSKAQPDGHTLLMAGGAMAINHTLYRNLPFDTLRDFTPIVRVASTVYAMVVSPSQPVRSVKELIALAKAQPGKVTFASAGVGAPPHLAGELLKMTAGVDMVHVPYKGTGPAIADVMAGQVSWMFSDALAAAPQIAGGKLRGLAVTSTKRFALVPELPTMIEAGVPGFAASGWTALMGPAGLPRPVLSRLNTEVVKVLPQADVKEKLAGDGSEFGKNTPEEFSAFLRVEIAKWAKVIKAAGAKVE